MKKIVLLCVVTLIHLYSAVVLADAPVQAKNYTHTPAQHHHCAPEYEHDVMDEYDHHVCDDVNPPKISAAKAFFIKILGELLIGYLRLQTKATLCIKKLKNMFSNWFNSFTHHTAQRK